MLTKFLNYAYIRKTFDSFSFFAMYYLIIATFCSNFVLVYMYPTLKKIPVHISSKENSFEMYLVSCWVGAFVCVWGGGGGAVECERVDY